MEERDIKYAANLLQKNWGVPISTALDLKALLNALQIQLEYMLVHDFEKLVQLMYRMDVYESKFREAMDLPEIKQQAEALANIVFQRELQRLETWKKYSSQG